MSTNAISGVGTVFKRAGVAIAEVNAIGGPNKTREMYDATSLDSVNGFREWIAGFRDGGEVSLEMNFSPATYGLMDADYMSDVAQNYEIVLPDTGNFSLAFSGFVTSLEMNVPMDDKITANVTIKITGDVTETT